LLTPITLIPDISISCKGKLAFGKIIVSNPSFEVWYLLHYEYSTRSYMNADAVIRELKKYYPGYEKTSDMYPLLKDKMDEAIARADRLENYHNAEEHQHPDVNCNPYTDVHRLVKKLIV
jgi:hypothetical protein